MPLKIISQSLLEKLTICRFSSKLLRVASRNYCKTAIDCPWMGSEKKEESKPEQPKRLYNPRCKVALVTGGISGIGFATATELLCAGAKNVVITGLDPCKGKEAENMLNNTFGSCKALFIKSNVSCIVQMEDAFKQTIEEYGKVNIFVNCAGYLDGSQWEKEFVTNVIGTVRGTLLAFKYIGKEGCGKGGCIVNVAGIPGFEPLPPAPTMSACWHAIVGFSRSMGHESNVGPAGLRILTLCPGVTQTEFCKKVVFKGMTEAMGKELANYFRSSKKQNAESCGRAVLHLIEYGPTGNVWWIEGSRLFSLQYLPKEKFSTLEAQFMT